MPLRSEQASIEDVRVRAIMGNRWMNFARSDACSMEGTSLLDVQILACWHVWSTELVGSKSFVLLSCPANTQRLRERPGPIKQQRIIATPIGKPQDPILELQSCAFLLHAKGPCAPTWRVCVRIGFAAFMPGVERGEKGVHTGIASLSVKLVVGETPHQVLRFEPDACMSDDAPEEDHCVRVQFAAGMRQCIELSRLAKMNAPNGILRPTRPLVCLARHAGALGTHLPTEERKELLLLVVGRLLLLSLNLCS